MKTHITKLLVILFFLWSHKCLNAQSKKLQSFAVSIYPNEKKIKPNFKIFDELHIYGYNANGVMLYTHQHTTDAADHHAYSLIALNAITKKATTFLRISFEDTVHSYNSHSEFFAAQYTFIQHLADSLQIKNIQPKISVIPIQNRSVKQQCNEITDMQCFNCRYTAYYKKKRLFSKKFEYVSSPKDPLQVYKSIQFEGNEIVLCNITYRGWEGLPNLIKYELFCTSAK